MKIHALHIAHMIWAYCLYFKASHLYHKTRVHLYQREGKLPWTGIRGFKIWAMWIFHDPLLRRSRTPQKFMKCPTKVITSAQHHSDEKGGQHQNCQQNGFDKMTKYNFGSSHLLSTSTQRLWLQVSSGEEWSFRDFAIFMFDATLCHKTNKSIQKLLGQVRSMNKTHQLTCSCKVCVEICLWMAALFLLLNCHIRTTLNWMSLLLYLVFAAAAWRQTQKSQTP